MVKKAKSIVSLVLLGLVMSISFVTVALANSNKSYNIWTVYGYYGEDVTV